MNRQLQTVLLLDNHGLTAQHFPLLAYYYDNRFDGQAYQDPERTTLAASGESVASWTERVAGSAHLAQSTAANEPINRGIAGLEFDGSNDFLTATIAEIPANGLTIYYRVNPDGIAANHVHLDWGNMTLTSVVTSGVFRANHSGVGAIGSSVATFNTGAVNTLGFRYNKTTGAYRICLNDATAVTGTQIRAVSGTSLHVGAEEGSSFRFDGKLLSIAIHTTPHTNDEMDAAMAYWRGV